jgi:hypothetical protein
LPRAAPSHWDAPAFHHNASVSRTDAAGGGSSKPVGCESSQRTPQVSSVPTRSARPGRARVCAAIARRATSRRVCARTREREDARTRGREDARTRGREDARTTTSPATLCKSHLLRERLLLETLTTTKKLNPSEELLCRAQCLMFGWNDRCPGVIERLPDGSADVSLAEMPSPLVPDSGCAPEVQSVDGIHEVEPPKVVAQRVAKTVLGLRGPLRRRRVRPRRPLEPHGERQFIRGRDLSVTHL